jgi:uncharacterized MAPEG superfamily protein
MTTALWCVLTTGLMPYATVALAKAGPGFDNHLPRTWLATLTGWRARAHAAHLNSFEAFPLFAVAVLVAQITGAAQHRVDVLALVFLGARVAYLFAYLADFASLRSIIWLVGIGTAVTIFVSGS